MGFKTKGMTCAICGEFTEMKDISFDYYDSRFERAIPCCKKCGQVYISKDFALKRMKEVEIEVESGDK